jgi:lysine 6-dehydrogenase
MSHCYAVIGAGRQGIAAAYDLAKFGKPDDLILIDKNTTIAKMASDHLNSLLGSSSVSYDTVNVSDTSELTHTLRDRDITTLISAVPYIHNLGLTDIALKSGINMFDMGGNTHIVQQQLQRDKEAKDRDITIVPDCGMGPGMNISLATYAMSLLQNPSEIYIWDGGLPQNPTPPWNYLLSFNIGGLTNEYYGHAYFLRKGKIIEVPCFTGYEKIDFPPIGQLEAFVTSGGLSTMPWTFQGTLNFLENKTLRYPGHWNQFKAFHDLGLLNLTPVTVGQKKIIPRDVFHVLLESKIVQPVIHDVALIRVNCRGLQNGDEAVVCIELIDYYDNQTEFMAMQRVTGWHTSILAILASQEKLPPGAIPVESVVSGDIIVTEARKRGFTIREKITKSP